VRFKALTLLLVVGALAGCSHTRPLSGGNLAVLPVTELPPPTPAMADGSERPYLIGPFDKIEVDVFGVPELSRREIQTDASGRISFPLAGTIEANGLTAEQVAIEIGNRLRGRYVRDPRVTINLVESVSRTVTVDGEVREPGRYPVVGRMTLMRAIASARGVSEFARLSEVVVFREVGDQRMAALYNLQAIRNGQYQDPEIFAGDVVMVGNSPGRRLFRDILQAAPLLTTPIIALLQSNTTP
jgi:polysaccharide export outer membrane protein